MSTRYNVSHKAKFGRGRSHYPQRLEARGLSKSPALAPIEGSSGLRARQVRRKKEAGHPWRVSDQEANTEKLTELTGKLAKHYVKTAA
jgi:hypothetical protein